MYRIQRLWLEPRIGAFLVVGRLDAHPVRFAVACASIDRYGWNSCMMEALRRLHDGERDFCIAPASPEPSSALSVPGSMPLAESA